MNRASSCLELPASIARSLGKGSVRRTSGLLGVGDVKTQASPQLCVFVYVYI